MWNRPKKVLTRASKALYILANIASKNGGSVVAISHSTYLRLLLCMVMDMPLSQVAFLEQKNGCINVLDIRIRNGTDQSVGSKSKMFGGKMSLAPSDFHLTIPEIDVVRINEKRHLIGLD